MQSIRVEHISKRFGDTQAVKDISFEVVPGEIFGLLGPNGSGKTTSIRVILDIYQPDSGTVSILGGPMSEAKKNQIGYLPEERGLYQDILLEKCLVYLATLKGMSAQQIRQKLPVYLEEFDLSAHKKKKVKELSKGMQQKAQLIATLIHDPQVIIIDEPFSALDEPTRFGMQDLIVDLWSQIQATIVLISHSVAEAVYLGDRVWLMSGVPGTIVAEYVDIPLPDPEVPALVAQSGPRFSECVAYVSDAFRKVLATPREALQPVHADGTGKALCSEGES